MQPAFCTEKLKIKTPPKLLGVAKLKYGMMQRPKLIKNSLASEVQAYGLKDCISDSAKSDSCTYMQRGFGFV